MNRAATPKIEREHGAVALVDADRGPGQVAGVFATDLSIQLARRHGAGVVAVHRSSHYGAAGYYAIRAAEAGMVGVSTTNSEPFVVPYGGVDHALGTNPIAIAAPTPDGIWDTDMATSQVAVNKIFNARDEGRTIPEGWGVDEEGRTTTDPGKVYAAVPLGGYKGYALALLVEVPLRRAVGLRRRPRHRPHLRGRAPGRRALPPRHRRRAPGRPRARRAAAGAAARRPQGGPARARLRRGPPPRRARAAHAGRARARRHPAARRRCGPPSPSSATSSASRCRPLSVRAPPTQRQRRH